MTPVPVVELTPCKTQDIKATARSAKSNGNAGGNNQNPAKKKNVCICKIPISNDDSHSPCIVRTKNERAIGEIRRSASKTLHD